MIRALVPIAWTIWVVLVGAALYMLTRLRGRHHRRGRTEPATTCSAMRW